MSIQVKIVQQKASKEYVVGSEFCDYTNFATKESDLILEIT